MSAILALLGIPALIKRIKDLEERVEKQEREINRLYLIREGDLRLLRNMFRGLVKYPERSKRFASRRDTDS